MKKKGMLRHVFSAFSPYIFGPILKQIMKVCLFEDILLDPKKQTKKNSEWLHLKKKKNQGEEKKFCIKKKRKNENKIFFPKVSIFLCQHSSLSQIVYQLNPTKQDFITSHFAILKKKVKEKKTHFVLFTATLSLLKKIICLNLFT